ncbi:MAG TPA: hypothetical protein VKB57_21365 [Acidimicrobiales bacterium]|nr:hypothetical protein [Acidimicrobiales bacterium]
MGPTTDGDGTDVTDDRSDRARQGMEHLQAAARELIAAARAALDVAEDVVNDTDSVAALAGLLGSVGEMARRVTGAAPGPADADDEAASEPAGTRVQRITVR